jgi:hypothetical protein
MPYTNSPLTYVLPVPLQEDVTFELYNPIDGTAWLKIPAGGLDLTQGTDPKVAITFRACHEVPDFEQAAVDHVAATEAFEIEIPAKAKLKDVQLSLPIFNWSGEIGKIELLRRNSNGKWFHVALPPSAVVLLPNGDIDYIVIKNPVHFSQYALGYKLH